MGQLWKQGHRCGTRATGVEAGPQVQKQGHRFNLPAKPVKVCSSAPLVGGSGTGRAGLREDTSSCPPDDSAYGA